MCLVLAALSLALLSQGAYYAPVQRLVGAALAAAGAITIAITPRRELVTVPVVGCLLLAAWSLFRGAAGGTGLGGARAACLTIGVATAFTVARRLTQEDRALLLRGVLLLGGLVALAGWAGVVWHVTPYALTNDGVWRGASTLTYANATAGVLGCLGLVLAGAMTGRAHDPRLGALLCLLLVGTGATLSRAGILALLVGALLLGVLRGPGRVLPVIVAPVLGAGVALVGLLPSMPLSAPGGRPVAVVALAAGLATACLLPTFTRKSALRAVLLVASVAAGVALLAGPRILSAAVDDVAGWRAHVSSPARMEAARAGVVMVAERPWWGVGPGDGWTSWRGADGARATMRYVHDEYLQVTVDLGLPGLLLLVVIFGGAVRAVRTAVRGGSGETGAGLAAGAAAALAATAVHAGFDFVWHVPAVPLLVATVVGLGCGWGTRPAPADQEQKGVVT